MGASVLWISYKVDSTKFTLFIWLAYLFLVVGAAKLGIWFVGRKKESPVEKKAIGNVNLMRQRMMQQKAMQQRALKQRAIQQKTQQKIIRFCTKCGNGLRGYENFCPMCAERVR